MPLLAVGELGAFVADFVGAGVGPEEGRHICQGGVGNVGEGFSREEGLVRSHDDVRHRDQAGEGVIGDNEPGVIVEEDFRSYHTRNSISATPSILPEYAPLNHKQSHRLLPRDRYTL